MIELTRINGKGFLLNCDLIEIVEETPDTVITLTSGKKYVVKQSQEEILELVIAFKNKINKCNYKLMAGDS
ncbi:MAG: flagellar FlbD family protein [Lachnospiraceae bacterium]|jgi:flagellar protein FlbD|nr:flagellar FlbD family protein [Lachnospiraceae bacterium]